MKQRIIALVEHALAGARRAGKLTSASTTVAVTVESPRDPAHGDLASNIALTLARVERKPPREIAEIIREFLPQSSDVDQVSVAGAGFINFRMAPSYWRRQLRAAAEEGPSFWRPRVGKGRNVQVEFLSANPTGPLTVGHGRNAVLGDTIARLYNATDYRVVREYYFNNGGRQMRLLGESVRTRYLQELGCEARLPEDGYEGEYIREIASGLIKEHGRTLIESSDSEIFRAAAEKEIFCSIGETCKRLGVSFDVYMNELDLIRSGGVDTVVRELRERGLVEDRDGAVWLRAEPLGLPKDQVLIRSGPGHEPTYRTPDIAYHIHKLESDYDVIIDVFGADHIDEHKGVIAALQALGHDTGRIHAVIYQFVTLTRAGEKVKMSTRKATYVTLDELIDEVGVDVVRFFFLSRKSDSHLDFDLDLAKRQAPENPVFYVQYAHARLASVFREAAKARLIPPFDGVEGDLALLCDEEIRLAKLLLWMPEVVKSSVEAVEPHRIPFYLLELAGGFHRYYNKPSNRIIGSDIRQSRARLFLAGLLKQAIASGLELLGVSAPEMM